MLTRRGHRHAGSQSYAPSEEAERPSWQLDKLVFPRGVNVASSVRCDELRVRNKQVSCTQKGSLALCLTSCLRPDTRTHLTVAETGGKVARYCDEIVHALTPVCNETVSRNLSPTCSKSTVFCATISYDYIPHRQFVFLINDQLSVLQCFNRHCFRWARRHEEYPACKVPLPQVHVARNFTRGRQRRG